MTPDQYTISEQRLAVGDGHELYVHEWGKKDAKQTFIYLHGGPGAGSSDTMKTLFDGTRDHVIFYDQRGAGKSTPAGSLVANTTDHLIADIEKILDTFGLKQVIVVGGSWGSTLALAYAIAHPDRVQAMLIRGVFTSRQQEIDHLEKGHFSIFFPEVWEQYLARTPAEHRNNPYAYHAARATSDDPKAVKESAYALDEFESTVSKFDDRHVAADFAKFDPNPARIEAHYVQNNCFIPENYIMDNLHKLTMPVWIVHGRYDMVCPAITAYEVSKRLPNAQLIFTNSGHTVNDRGNFDAHRAVISALAAN